LIVLAIEWSDDALCRQSREEWANKGRGDLRWLTGYTQKTLQKQIEKETTSEAFVDQAPGMNSWCELIQGVVCGMRVENVEEPLMREIRYLDRLIDELAKGKAMERSLRL